MARKIRIEYADATYHVMDLGNQGREICRDEIDRKLWLATLAEACEKSGLLSYVFRGRLIFSEDCAE